MIIKHCYKSLLLILTIVFVSACQSLSFPLIQDTEEFSRAFNHEFSLKKHQSVFGQMAEIESESGDSLALIARHFGLGFDEIMITNPEIDPWIPESGKTVKLPLKFILPNAPKKGFVLNLAAKRLFYFPKNKKQKMMTFPIGIGREGWLTPTGKTKIVAKKKHPRWVVPRSILLEHAKKGDPLPKVVAAGPNNPLGDYAIRLGIPGYLIHSTNKPYGVGMAVSHGCIRLYPEDMEILFDQVSIHTPVHLLNQPFLMGWNNDQLYIQIYPAPHASQKKNTKQLTIFKRKLKRIEAKTKRAIAWDKVAYAIAQQNGIPISIFTDNLEKEHFLKFTHAINLSDSIKPAPLNKESWKIKVSELSTKQQAQRFAAMLNHQGPQIPAHVISSNTSYFVVAGPFDSKKQAKASYARLRIDFSLDPELIQPGESYSNISGITAVLSSISTFFD